MKRSMWITALLAAAVWAATLQVDPASAAVGTAAASPPAAASSGPAGFVAGSSREIVEERTEFTALFANPDGSKTVRSSSAPLHFSVGKTKNAWERIDTAVVADGATPGVLRTKANSWTARFRPLPAGVDFETPEGPLSFAPLGAAAVAPQVTGDGSVVVYPDAWPGVDLRYTVTPTEVKEDLVLKRRPATSTFEFATGGTEFDPTPEGGLAPKGRDPKKGRLAPPEVTDTKGTELTAAKPTMRAVKDATGARLQLRLDDKFLADTPASAYPIIFDPTVQLGSGNMQNYKTYPNGAVASCLSACMLRVGNTVEPWNGALTNVYWRSVGYFDYTSAMGASVSDVWLDLARSPGEGTAEAYANNVKVFLPNAYSWPGATGGGVLMAQGTVGENTGYQPIRGPGLTNQIAAWARDRVWGGALGFTGLEQPGLYTYKKFSIFNLNVTYNPTPPGTPASLSATAQRDGSAVLSYPAATPDGGGGAVRYEVKAFTGGTQVGGTFNTTSSAPVTWNGLVDGATYTFTVQAFNSVGGSGVRTSAPILATRYAAAPPNVKAWPGNATGWVTWDPADPRGGPPITGYEVYLCKSDGSGCYGPTPVPGHFGRSQVNPPGITNGIPYLAVVRALTARGIGDNGLSQTLTLSATAAPFPVQQVSASAGSGTRTWIGWHPPEANGAGPLTKYLIWRLVNGVYTQYWDNIPATPPAGGTVGTFEATDLSDTRPSTYEVYPFNANGYVGAPGPGPATGVVTPAANAAPYPPQRPQGSTDPVNRPSLDAGDGQVVLRWSLPAANGATGSCPTPTAYAAYLVDRAGGPMLTQTVTGLIAIFTAVPSGACQPGIINGHTYIGVVYSLNSSGSCANSGWSGAAITGYGTPQGGGDDLLNATDPVATRGNQEANVSWKAPSLALGLATYTIKATPGPTGSSTNPAPSVGATTITTEVMTGGPRLNRTIGGLRNGTTYTFTVTANLVLGLVSTAESGPSKPIIPAGRPFPAQIGIATRGDQSANINWEPPADDPATGIPGNNGDPITRYDVQIIDQLDNVISTRPNIVRGGSVGQLINGTPYRFRVIAVNGVGMSDPSTVSNEVIPAGKPFPPVNVQVTPGDRSAVVRWDPPPAQSNGSPGDNGAPIVSYTLQVFNSSGTVIHTSTTASSPFTLSGMTPGSSYQFRVLAVNSVGSSAPATSSIVVALGPPSAPTVTATAGNGQVTVAWTSASSNGAPVTGYVVRNTRSGVESSFGAEVRSATVTGLNNGESYAFTVQGINSYGPGRTGRSSTVIPQGTPPQPPNPTAPSMPRVSSVTSTATDLKVQWLRPSATNGSTITGYQVTTKRGDGTVLSVVEKDAQAEEAVVGGLTPGTNYVVTVLAHSSAGDGWSSDPKDAWPAERPLDGMRVDFRLNDGNNGTIDCYTRSGNATPGNPRVIFCRVREEAGNFEVNPSSVRVVTYSPIAASSEPNSIGGGNYNLVAGSEDPNRFDHYEGCRWNPFSSRWACSQRLYTGSDVNPFYTQTDDESGSRKAFAPRIADWFSDLGDQVACAYSLVQVFGDQSQIDPNTIAINCYEAVDGGTRRDV